MSSMVNAMINLQFGGGLYDSLMIDLETVLHWICHIICEIFGQRQEHQANILKTRSDSSHGGTNNPVTSEKNIEMTSKFKTKLKPF